ncbi:homoserine dehydrogenase [Gammaproteobacteria bacterium]|nr:homoserine dehydrogenase [Gammaproteobacteria bacterium]MDC1502828.1 homoserine dehydrogenase [Gammaproteobacteria bacterium]
MNSDKSKTLKVGICGYGTVGSGTLALLQGNAKEITRKTGVEIEVYRVASRSLQVDIAGVTHSGTDPFEVANDPDVDVVVEAMGGFDPAYDVVHKALENGKHVVTANKALIAERGAALIELAEQNDVTLAYESAVAGGIPIIKALREGLAANRIDWLAGIINGTGNFILSEMMDKQREFADVLEEAQALGYAEADPTFDVEGIDAAHKLTIMASIAFGMPLAFDKTYTEGISALTPGDIGYAKELGYHIKHLGIARLENGWVQTRVHPTLISTKQLLAHVHGVGNAVVVHGHAVGSTLYNGPGAGAEATASSVVADIIDIARAKAQGLSKPSVPILGFETLRTDFKAMTIDEIETEYYLRITAQDVVGVMANVASELERHGIGIDALIQKESDGKNVPIVILTDKAREGELNQAIEAIEKLASVTAPVMRIRVESFGE